MSASARDDVPHPGALFAGAKPRTRPRLSLGAIGMRLNVAVAKRARSSGLGPSSPNIGNESPPRRDVLSRSIGGALGVAGDAANVSISVS